MATVIFQNRRQLISPKDFSHLGFSLSHMSNPTPVKISDSRMRIFFNSRNELEQSEVWSVDFDASLWSVDVDSIQRQYHLSGKDPEYFRNGISLGNFFEYNGISYISFMGWSSNAVDKWEGSIGLMSVDDNFCISSINNVPLVNALDLNSLSLSYPHITQSDEGFNIWVGCMEKWDAGNGEMLHPMKKFFLKQNGGDPLLIETLPFQMNSFQCFSRPSLVQFQGMDFMAYSVRGSNDSYHIELLINLESKSDQIKGIFRTSKNQWENGMIEYPYLFVLRERVVMFYNGNNFGASGIGICEVLLDD